MCGRYALGIRASFARWQLQQQGLQVNEAPADEDVRETYNFPPGAIGLVYRAETPDTGLREDDDASEANGDQSVACDVHYQLKAMKWGLIPFWTKRSPDYGSMMRTINCRDDSLIENRGMWNTMKQRKRCIVVAQGFYEWLKKGPGGKEKVPHFVKRTDGNLMCFAGLWDCVKYEDAEEKLYTYTIITTDVNKQLRFLHDRMPVILDPNTDAMKKWLDPTINKWSSDLQSLLKPYDGPLDCYPVNKEVGKVGNNSPDFIVPVDSKENKNNIANFFGTAGSKASPCKSQAGQSSDVQVQCEQVESRSTRDDDSIGNHAPKPVFEVESHKRKHEIEDDSCRKLAKTAASPTKTTAATSSKPTKKGRSATSNEGATIKGISSKQTTHGSPKITSFFST